VQRLLTEMLLAEEMRIGGYKASLTAAKSQRAFVVPKPACGQSEDALQDAGDHAAGRVAAVLFQVELALEGVVDRFVDRAQRLEQARAGSSALALARGPSLQSDAGLGHGGLEVTRSTTGALVRRVWWPPL
jgi:hypothetical protein